MKADEAIVLVGGLGTRLRSVVSELPKPLAPVAGRPFLAWVLDNLVEGGVRHIILATGHLSEKVEQAVGTTWAGASVDYSIEARPLGTGGAVRKACRLLRGDRVHVLNGDTYLSYEPAALADAVTQSDMDLGIALAEVPDVSRYGSVDCMDGRVTGFREKGSAGRGLVNAGCYFLSAAAIAALPHEESFSFETMVLAPMTAAGRVHGYLRTQRFIDIGVPADYLRAQALFGSTWK